MTADATTWDRRLSFAGDEVILTATGFRAPLGDLRELGVVTVMNDRDQPSRDSGEASRCPESSSRGTSRSPREELAKDGVAANSSSVNGFRYNARPRPSHRRAARDRAAAAAACGGGGRPVPPRRAGARARALDPEGLPRASRVVRQRGDQGRERDSAARALRRRRWRGGCRSRRGRDERQRDDLPGGLRAPGGGGSRHALGRTRCAPSTAARTGGTSSGSLHPLLHRS